MLKAHVILESFQAAAICPKSFYAGARVLHDCQINQNASRAALRALMRQLVERGARGIIPSRTEFSLPVSAADASVPRFDTAALHACAAAEAFLAALRFCDFPPKTLQPSLVNVVDFVAAPDFE